MRVIGGASAAARVSDQVRMEAGCACQTPRVSDVTTAPTWRERITGRWALSWQAYVVGVLVNLPLLVVSGGRIGTRIVPVSDMGVLFVYGAAASLVVGGWALLMNATVFRNRRVHPVALWQFAMLHLVSGAIFGVAVVMADVRLGINLGVPPALTLVATMGIAVWWGTTIALLLEAHERFVRDRARLLDEAVLGQLALMQESRADVILADEPTVTATLADARERLEPHLAASASLSTWLDAAQALRATADETVRPLSHALWREASERYPEPRVSNVLALLVREPAFLPLPAASVIVIGYLGATSQEYGALLGPLLALALGVISWAVLTVGNVVMHRAPRVRPLTYLASVILVQAAALLLAYGPARAEGSLLPPSLIAGSILGTLIAVLLTSVVASLDAARAQVIRQLQSAVNQERIAQAARTRARALTLREAAKELHGTVQTRLIACASAIEMAAASGDVSAYERALRESLGILEGAHTPAQGTVTTRLDVLASSWGALCEISVRVDPSLGPELPGDVVRVVEEAIGNAYRHGGATRITVVIAALDGDIRVTVADNGSGPGGGDPGLGSDLLARATGGRHELTAVVDGGSVLTAVIAGVPAAQG